METTTNNKRINVTTRKAELADVKELCAVINEAYRSTGGWTGESDLVKGVRIKEEELEKQIKEDKVKILVAETTIEGKNQIVGTVAVKPYAEGEAEIGQLAVSPKLQSGGVGTKIINAGFSSCVADLKANKAVVTVLSMRDDILKWYKKLGFVETGEMPLLSWMEMMVENGKFIILKKDLSSM